MWFIFFNSNEYQIFKKIIALEYEFPSGFPEVPKGLVQSLLVSELLCYSPLDGIWITNALERISRVVEK